MSTLQFPYNPKVGDTYDWQGFRYVYDGEKWKTTGVGYNPVNSLRDELVPRIEAEETDTKDWEGFTAELLAQAGIEDDGQPDELGNSQRVDAMRLMFRNVGTVADIATGKFAVGTRVLVVDRAMAEFTIYADGAANGVTVLDAGYGKTAKQSKTYVTALSLGFDNSGGNTSKNADVWDVALSDSSIKGIVFDCGTYYFSRQIVGRTQFQIKGEAKQSLQQRTVIFFSDTASIGNGNALLKCAPGTTQIQSFTANDITFAGDTLSPDGFNLSTIPDSGFYGIDVSGVKEGLDLDGCGFRSLRAGLAILSGHGYLGEPRLTNQYYKLCYKAWHKLVSTADADISGTYVYDCNTIGEMKSFVGNNVRFNNSHYSGEDTGLTFTRGVLNGVWTEGFNNVFNVSAGGHLELNGGYLSEAFSSSGASKLMVKVAEGSSVVMNGTRLPINTRMFNFATTDFTKYYIRLCNTTNALTPFGLLSSSINYYISRGLIYSGTDNEALAFNVTTQRQSNFGYTNWNTLQPAPISSMPINFITSVAITVDFGDYLTSNSSFRFGFLEFEVVGTNDSAGGGSVYNATIKILKGVGSTWRVDISGVNAASYSAVISNPTATTATITISELHEGVRDMLIQRSASASCRFNVIA